MPLMPLLSSPTINSTGKTPVHSPSNDALVQYENYISNKKFEHHQCKFALKNFFYAATKKSFCKHSASKCVTRWDRHLVEGWGVITIWGLAPRYQTGGIIQSILINSSNIGCVLRCSAVQCVAKYGGGSQRAFSSEVQPGAPLLWCQCKFQPVRGTSSLMRSYSSHFFGSSHNAGFR